ncbi:hypothetical protein IJJ08_05145 [bacterium]|nr:hypothetical protein [bacterium]
MSRRGGQIILAAIFLLMVGQSINAATGNKTKKLNELTTGQVVKIGGVSFVKTASNQLVATSLCPQGSTYSSFYKGCVVQTTDFAYTGNVQTFTAPADGYYVLEVWGAQGYGMGWMKPTTTNCGGKGGYGIGVTNLLSSEKLYLQVGGSRTSTSNYSYGYNGGGNGAGRGSSTTAIANGGGATHIAVTSRGVLANYENYQSEVLIVAGGGGGIEWGGDAGNGGGVQGTAGSSYHKNEYSNASVGTSGGTQTSAGTNKSGNSSYTMINNPAADFGLGGGAYSQSIGDYGCGGGGGWYGGGGTSWSGACGGGSGYIGNSALLSLVNFSKHMTCYDCLESTGSATLTFSNTCASETPIADCAKIGNGAARITQLSVYLGI